MIVERFGILETLLKIAHSTRRLFCREDWPIFGEVPLDDGHLNVSAGRAGQVKRRAP